MRDYPRMNAADPDWVLKQIGDVSDEEAVDLLLALPEFQPYYEESLGRPSEQGDELLLHVVMGDPVQLLHEAGRSE